MRETGENIYESRRPALGREGAWKPSVDTETA
jgi:hypothetical protein